jgi:flagellar basal body rod protein FlgB
MTGPALREELNMDRMIYLSMSGAKATMQRQETLANNLANVSTVGFRAELAAFRAVPVQGSGAEHPRLRARVDARLRRHARPDRRDRPQPRRRR